RTARAGGARRAVGLGDEASALNLEAIEKFIGQKIPVEWAEDDLFVPEIKPSAEERRRFAEERRARVEAPRGFDRGGRHGGGGRHRGRSGPAPPPPPPPPPVQPGSGPPRGAPAAGR